MYLHNSHSCHDLTLCSYGNPGTMVDDEYHGFAQYYEKTFAGEGTQFSLTTTPTPLHPSQYCLSILVAVGSQFSNCLLFVIDPLLLCFSLRLFTLLCPSLCPSPAPPLSSPSPPLSSPSPLPSWRHAVPTDTTGARETRTVHLASSASDYLQLPRASVSHKSSYTECGCERSEGVG